MQTLELLGGGTLAYWPHDVISIEMTYKDGEDCGRVVIRWKNRDVSRHRIPPRPEPGASPPTPARPSPDRREEVQTPTDPRKWVRPVPDRTAS